MNEIRRPFRPFAAALIVALPLCAACLSGCERKEKVFELETPDGQIEVERSKDTGEVEIEID